MSSRVEAIGTCSLVLSNSFILELDNTFYIPSFSRNLISISRLVPLGFSFSFLDSGFSLSNKSKVIGYVVHCMMAFSIFGYKMILLRIIGMLLLD